MRGGRDEEWIGERPGCLPWWRLGRPPKTEAEDPDEASRQRRHKDIEGQGRERPTLTTEEFVEMAAKILGVAVEELAGRGRGAEVVRAREILAATGVEWYGLRVKDLAACLDKHPVTASGWVMRGVQRPWRDSATAKQIEALTGALISGGR
jgi:hypothetical protein